jgi:drug/metabolite transporter (DMT)-like permease
MLTGFIFYFLVVVPGTGGEICMSRTMKMVGEVADFHPRTILRAIGRAMTVSWFWIGITMMAAGFFAILGLLSLANVSFVFPASAISYALGTLGGKIFLDERVTPQRWFGVALVCVGVALVFLGTPR